MKMNLFSPGAPTASLSLGDLLASLSGALDITAGQTPGHAVRTCVIGMRIASNFCLPDEKMLQLYYSLLLKDSGASSSATRMFQLFNTNEVAAKRAYRLVDWTNPLEAGRFMAAYSRSDDNLINRAKRVIRTASNPSQLVAGISRDRAHGGEVAVRDLGFGDEVVEAVRGIDENFDGTGAPHGLCGTAIPLLSRIIAVAQTLDTFSTAMDVGSAYDVLTRQCGSRYDPDIVETALAFATDERFWAYVKEKPRQLLRSYETAFVIGEASSACIDAVCGAFGRIVDAKSPYTRAHSRRVSEYAVEIGRALDLGGDRIRVIRRAALLHDIGKLAVPNSILEKPQKLNDDEWARIKKYPWRTEQILGPIRGFRRLAEVACAHNERIDGSGYHRGIKEDEIDLDMRIVAVADVYDALTSDRPQRQAMPIDKVFRILDEEGRRGLDPRCVTVLKQHYRGGAVGCAARTPATHRPLLKAA
ncbi:MAG TPA: HD domain-containing phosphohydrolase [Capsulimonadaceae bacterium]|jgi:HD-GYP domain-containing protein (c-di-GMP phosphodiesterase class II)